MLDQFLKLFSRLTPVTKLYFGVAAVIIFSMFIAMIALWRPVNMAPLYTELTPADASSIIEELKAEGVDYRLAAGGSTVYVPADSVPELRINMAGKGLPSAGVVGFELFDKGKMGVTETGMTIDYKRALEGELMRTLMGLTEVRAARVHLVLPKETSFLAEPEPSSASVVLHLTTGARLRDSQVKGIVHLIKHAVENLAEDGITVTDGDGNIIYGASSDSPVSGEQLAYKRKVERDLEAKVVKVLERVYGSGKVAAAATVEIDFSSVSKQSEEFSPVVGDQGIVRTESLSDTEKEVSATGSGGIPGTFSNIPGYVGSTGDGGSSETESNSTATRGYEVNRLITETELMGGAIISRSISVVITDEDFSDVKRVDAEGLIAAAIGANITGGDKIYVTGKPPSPVGAPEGGVIVRAIGNQRLSDYIRYAIAAIIVIVALLVLRGMVNTLAPSLKLALEGIDILDEVPSLDFALRAAEEEAMDEDLAFRDIKRVKEVPRTKHMQIREEVINLLKDNPEGVVKMIRNWLLED
ncbi:flagellar M-ring protein FliF [bacterium]|nr:flagellar M-ring protein FliF [bacterium]